MVTLPLYFPRGGVPTLPGLGAWVVPPLPPHTHKLLMMHKVTKQSEHIIKYYYCSVLLGLIHLDTVCCCAA